MTWVRIDDGAPLHPKLLTAGAEAGWLWLAGLAYANRYATDGTIPPQALPTLYPVESWTRTHVGRLAARLVEVGLWTPREGGGWTIHDYSQYQEEALRASVDERRQYERDRKRRQREARKEALAEGLSRRDSPGQVPGQSRGTGAGQVRGTTASTSTPPVPAPRPGPARPVPLSPPTPPSGGLEAGASQTPDPEGTAPGTDGPQEAQEGAPKAPTKRWVTREEFAAARPPRGSLEAMAEDLGYGLKGV